MTTQNTELTKSHAALYRALEKAIPFVESSAFNKMGSHNKGTRQGAREYFKLAQELKTILKEAEIQKLTNERE